MTIVDTRMSQKALKMAAPVMPGGNNHLSRFAPLAGLEPIAVKTISPQDAGATSRTSRPPMKLRGRISAGSLRAAFLVFGFALFAGPPAFGAVERWGWAGMVVLLMMALTLWSASVLFRGPAELVWSPLFVPAGLFLLLAAFQFAARRTADLISTRNSVIELAGILAAFFLVLQLGPAMGSNAWRRLGIGVVGYTFSMALFAVIQYFSSPGKLYWCITPRSKGWIFGPYLDHDHYSGLMELLIPISACYVLSQHRRRGSRVLMGFAVLFPVVSVLLSGSRGGMLSLLIEALLLVTVLLSKGPRGRTAHAALWVTAALAAAFIAFAWMDTGRVAQHLETVFEPSHESDESFASRVETARDALRMFRAQWKLGTGLGSFEYAFPKYQTLPGDDVWDHAHNDYVETLAETGVAGGVLIVVALALWFRLAFRNLDERLRLSAGWIQLGAALGCCGLLFHSYFDFNLHIPANALWFAVCAAVATTGTPLGCRAQF